MKQSTTLSMGTTVAGNPYLIQAAEYITPGLPYFAAIGIDDEDRHIRERVQTACEATGYAWPECRTTVLLLPTNQPKRPGLCVLAAAVCIMAADGTIGIPDLESTVILGDVNADGTIPPLGEDVDLTALIEHAREQGIQRVILPAADLAQAGKTGRRRNHWSGKPQRPETLTRIRRRGVEPLRTGRPLKPPEPTRTAHARQGTAPAPGTTDPPLRFGASPTTDHAPPCPVRRGRETERRTSAPPPKAFPCDRSAKAFGS